MKSSSNGEGEEKIKIKRIKKRGGRKAYFCYPKNVCLYFLKTKTTSFHKVIYFKKNNLYKIRLCIFFPMVGENIEF